MSSKPFKRAWTSFSGTFSKPWQVNSGKWTFKTQILLELIEQEEIWMHSLSPCKGMNQFDLFFLPSVRSVHASSASMASGSSRTTGFCSWIKGLRLWPSIGRGWKFPFEKEFSNLPKWVKRYKFRAKHTICHECSRKSKTSFKKSVCQFAELVESFPLITNHTRPNCPPSGAVGTATPHKAFGKKKPTGKKSPNSRDCDVVSTYRIDPYGIFLSHKSLTTSVRG